MNLSICAVDELIREHAKRPRVQVSLKHLLSMAEGTFLQLTCNVKGQHDSRSSEGASRCEVESLHGVKLTRHRSHSSRDLSAIYMSKRSVQLQHVSSTAT